MITRIRIDAYVIKCDNCKKLFESGEGYTVFIDQSSGLESASDSDWSCHNDHNKQYCDACHFIDENDNLSINARRLDLYK